MMYQSNARTIRATANHILAACVLKLKSQRLTTQRSVTTVVEIRSNFQRAVRDALGTLSRQFRNNRPPSIYRNGAHVECRSGPLVILEVSQNLGFEHVGTISGFHQKRVANLTRVLFAMEVGSAPNKLTVVNTNTPILRRLNPLPAPP